MHIRTKLSFAAALLIILASCSKTNKQGTSVPQNAFAVMHINGESLSAKLPWDELKKNEAFREMYADSTLPPYIKNVLDNPDNAGIDIKKDMVIFMATDSSGGYAVVEGTVKDAAKFNTFNILASNGGNPVTKDGINYIIKYPTCAGWNKDKFIYVTDLPSMKRKSLFSTGENDYLKNRDIAATCAAVFALKEDNSLGKNEKFTDLVSDKADLHIWINSNQIMEMNGSMGVLGMTKAGDMAKDIVSAISVNFDNGQIKMDAKSYFGKDLTALYKKYEGNSINTDMAKRFAGKNVAGMLALNFKPGFIKELIGLTGMDGLINMLIGKYGFTIEDFVRANKGDIFIGIDDFKMKTDTVRYGKGPQDFYANSNAEPNFLFAASINDKAAFTSLIKAGQKQFGGDLDSPSDKMFFNSNDKFFVLGNNKAFVDGYLTTNNNDFSFLSKMSGKPIGGYANFQAIMKAVEKDVEKDTTAKKVFDLSQKMWQDAYLSGGNFDDGAVAQHIEINLMDKATNSLKQLNDYAGKLAALRKSGETSITTTVIEEAPVTQVRPDTAVPKIKH
jgi:Domain of unknown function (DUF4836)